MQLRVLGSFEDRHSKVFVLLVGITVGAVSSIKPSPHCLFEQEILSVYHQSLQGPGKEFIKATSWANLWLAISFSMGNFVYARAYWWGFKQIIESGYTQKQFFIVLIALLVSA